MEDSLKTFYHGQMRLERDSLERQHKIDRDHWFGEKLGYLQQINTLRQRLKEAGLEGEGNGVKKGEIGEMNKKEEGSEVKKEEGGEMKQKAVEGVEEVKKGE